MNTRTLIITFVWMIMSNIGIFAQEHWDAQERIELNKGVFPKNFSKAIDIIQYDLLGIERGKSHVKVIDNNTLYINLSFSLKNSVQQGDWRIAVKPDFLPSFHWAPHLTPTDRNVIDQHVFRSPALIVADDHQTLILIPDLDIMQKGLLYDGIWIWTHPLIHLFSECVITMYPNTFCLSVIKKLLTQKEILK